MLLCWNYSVYSFIDIDTIMTNDWFGKCVCGILFENEYQVTLTTNKVLSALRAAFLLLLLTDGVTVNAISMGISITDIAL